MILKELKTKSKPKFDKAKCLKCKYRSTSFNNLSYAVVCNNRVKHVLCDYANLTGVTCLKPGPNNSVVDMRGEDYNNCMLFSEGPRLDKEKTQLIISEERYDNRG